MSGWSQCMRVNSHRGADLVSCPSCSPAARLGGDVCLHERIRGCFTTWGPVRPPSAARGFDLLGLRDQFGMDSVEATGSPGNGNRTVFCFCSECLLVSLCWDGLCGGVLCPLVFVCSGWSLISNPLFCSEIKEKEREQSVSSSQVTVKANQTKTNRSRRAEVTEMIPRQNNNFFSPKIRLETRSSSCRWWVQTDALKRLNSVFCFKSVLFSIKATFNGYCGSDLAEPF